ncbi:MAG: acyl-CoA dehydrogenase family protein [Dehalococcoidales bacterium]|nr:acyl-CoA dehydrogenase family protein [Dehalococcoidales bacterium]
MDFNLSEEQLMLQSMVKDFTAKEIEPRGKQIDDTAKIPEDLMKKYADLGLFGMAVPKEYDGSEMGNFAKILALEQLAYAGCPAWWPVAFNNSLPFTIYKFGNDEQRQKYVKGNLDGSKLYSIQFTEPETGSDPTALKTTAKKDGDYYIINGQKRFSTFGQKNGTAIVWTKDDEGGCTAFLVEKNTKGYSAPTVWELMAGEGEPADVYYEDYRVHKDNILYGKGKGFDVLLFWISVEKIEGCIVAVAMAQAALDEAVKYGKERIVRGKPMSDMQGIRWEYADMYAKIQACRWMTYRTAALLDTDPKAFQREAAACKIFVQPTCTQVILDALRLHGGYGITKEFKIERLYRSQPGNIVISVSLEINKSIVGSALVR